jgi:malate dehydrogenase (oxaloacetate-decarboxylating)
VIPVSQGNNVYIFPGVGLGTIVSKAREVTESMFSAAAMELARQAEEAGGGLLYPPIGDLRATTRLIGAVVAREACDAGVAEPMTDQEIEAALDAEVWDLSYPVLIPGRN